MNAAMKGKLIAALLGLGLFITLVPRSHAVIISPVHLNMSVKEPIISFTVTNDSEDVITYQINTLSWQQIDGKDTYNETIELIVSPPIVSIEPNSTQTFRVGLFKESSHLVEQAYRIVLDDITTYLPDQSKNSLKFIFNQNLPLFYAPVKRIDSVVWSTCESALSGTSCLLIENKGNRHVKLVNFIAVSATQEEPLHSAKTVLAGSTSKLFYPTTQGEIETTTSIKVSSGKGPIVLVLADLPYTN
jgi:P pilus assembly chaperone PapD